MKNILVNYVGRTGGGALYSYEMVKGLIENGCNVYAILSNQAENIGAWKKLNFKKIVFIDTYMSKSQFLWRTIKFFLSERTKLRNEFSNIPIDFIYIPMLHNWTRIINSVFEKTELIVTVHDPIQHSGEGLIKKIIHWFNDKEIKKAKYIVILSKQFKQYIVQQYEKNNAQVHVIPHGIFDAYKNNGNIHIAKYDAKKINFLFFGRIEKYKGLEILGNAYVKLEQKYPNKVHLTIAGDGDLAKYEDQFKEIKNITILNRWIKDEEVSSLFEGHNVVTVLPYIDATQSGIISIAMSCRSLIIASDTGGLREQLSNGDLGVLVESGNADRLYKAMEEVLLCPIKYDQMIESAACFVQSLSWKELSKDLIKIIHQ